jgi:magnesium transporter
MARGPSNVRTTVIATIFIPLSFLTGFFGMNFGGIPFSKAWLLAIVLAVMAGLPVTMLLLFARLGWLTEGRPPRTWGGLRAWLRRRG